MPATLSNWSPAATAATARRPGATCAWPGPCGSSAIATALADGIEIPEVPAAQGSDDDHTADAGEVMDAGEVTGAGEPAGGDDEGVRVVRPMQTAQAAAIVFELERVRSRVPVDDLDVAEEQLVRLAAHIRAR